MPKPPLIIDSNIISNALSPKQTKAYAALFHELEQSYRFVVTGYTQFELLRSSDKKHREKYLDYIDTDMTRIDLSSILMEFSARLYYVYSKHPKTNGLRISDGDIINAAVAIIKDCPVLTQDSFDYPAPFFKEISRHEIRFQSIRGRDVIDMLYILTPDKQHTKYCFDEHDK